MVEKIWEFDIWRKDSPLIRTHKRAGKIFERKVKFIKKRKVKIIGKKQGTKLRSWKNFLKIKVTQKKIGKRNMKGCTF